MSNEELAEAIAYAFGCCNQAYIGGYTTSNTDVGRMMLTHLKELLSVQLDRAKEKKDEH